MKEHYVFIDYENVQPDISILLDLKKKDYNVILFVGANQEHTLTAATALAHRTIQISGSGKNALDFHIAFYIGQISTRNPEGIFHIVSKDTGFKRLIEHLKTFSIVVHPVKDAKELLGGSVNQPAKAPAPTKPKTPAKTPAKAQPDMYGKILQSFQKTPAQSRPKSRKSLFNKIKDLNKNLLETQIDAIIDRLSREHRISLEAKKVVWHPEETPTAS